ncbi:MAG: aspartate carbamoyltransferase catalytic subunit [Balneola sp.]|nr:aspartate carbamoyltransferase catalytic subunit [Balneola sp.]MBO6650271.1 aspartate carbamoyltransferase catalytic subunit [Balneola sp.]MBO6712143.1 aspartate carbamoyltransferase catalytic subunit [Balneola sp.]MBO6800337.1 aspartate carbamoyltransferase catalytic subunit [Balneola sp.]MBO6869649.1 aspartate carbamoyltransferase catalytic subunit [Balneola sp.]
MSIDLEKYNFTQKHLLGLADYSADDIRFVLEQAKYFREILDRPVPKVPTLRDKTIVNLFYENSTRTRLSFELAQKRMGADVVNFSASTSSTKKGESLKDTIQNISSMKIDMVVVRHESPGVPHFLTQCVDAAILNAGDGAHEHPTQALLDMFTMQQIHPDLKGKKIAIIGDIAYSRVVRSNIIGLTKLGAEVVICGPKTLMPVFAKDLGVTVSHNLEETLAWCDIAMALRIQLERQGKGTELFPSLREYHERFGIKLSHLEKYPDFKIMHPGPINRGVEMESEVADSNRAIILNQVTNGVAVRMAVLYLLSGGNRV